MRLHTHKFQFEDGDFDWRTDVRRISGRFTEKRKEILDLVVSKYNEDNYAPYGISKNGYPYRCGCVRDCCGCLVSRSMHLEYVKMGNNEMAILSICDSYNY